MVVKNLRKSREEMEIKQKDVSESFKLSFTTISGWETGKDTMPFNRLITYANQYHFSLDYLFGLVDQNINYSNICLDLKLLGINLCKLRKMNNMTQMELASKLNIAQSAYSRYENGIRLIPTTILYGLTQIYKPFSIDLLLNRKRLK